MRRMVYGTVSGKTGNMERWTGRLFCFDGVLRRFQHYFSYITATAHLFMMPGWKKQYKDRFNWSRRLTLVILIIACTNLKSEPFWCRWYALLRSHMIAWIFFLRYTIFDKIEYISLLFAAKIKNMNILIRIQISRITT